MADAEGDHAYPPHIRGQWYQYIRGTAPQAKAADQEWRETWDTTADYMIRKQAAGLSILNAQETLINRSSEAVGLPVRFFTEMMTHAQTVAECQQITTLGDTWC